MGGQGDIRRFFAAPASSQSRSGPSLQQQSQVTSKESAQSKNDAKSRCPQLSGTSVFGSTQHKTVDEALDREPGMPKHTNLANASFSSNLTSTSSQRRIRNGELIILDSSDSDSDLEDVSVLLSRFKGQQPTPTTPIKDDIARGVPKISHDGRTNRRAAPSEKTRAEIRLTQAKSKYSLDRLAADVARQRASEDKLEAVLDAIGSSGNNLNVLESPERKRAIAQKLDPTMLATMIGDDEGEDGVERLLHAVERTEAARSTRTWLFFDDGPAPPKRLAPPRALITRWGSRLKVEVAFNEGELSDAAACGELLEIDEDILNWGFRYTINDADDIHHHYCFLLQVAEYQGNWNFSVDWVRSMFSMLGATSEGLAPTEKLHPVGGASDNNSNDAGWNCVRRVLEIIPRMVQSSRASISSEDRLAVFGILCKLSMDPGVETRRGVLFALQDAMEITLDKVSLADLSVEGLSAELSEHIDDPQLYSNLVRGVTDGSSNVAFIRHRLSQRFIFKNHDDDRSPNLLMRLSNRLAKSSDFKIGPGMDFAWLTSMITILDVAVGDGDPEFHPEEMSEDYKRQFNKTVDGLADRVRLMSSQIRDTGANHISKTEAKEALDALYTRLLFAVRTEPRPKRNVFGKSVGTTRLDNGAGLARFLMKKEARAAEEGVEVENLTKALSEDSDDDAKDSADEWYDAGEMPI